MAFAIASELLGVESEFAGNLLGMTLLGLVGIYYLIALKRYYGDGWVRTTIKFGVLVTGYAVLLLPGFLLVMGITFALV